MLHKTVPAFFLIMDYSLFIALTPRVWKTHFAWKQLKVDYSKNIWKEGNHGHVFVCLLVGYMSVKKNYWKLQFCGCRSSESRENKFFSPNLTLILPIFGEHKKVNYIYWKRLVLAHLRRYYKNMYVIAL